MELSIFYNGQFFVALVEYKMVNNSKFIQYTFGNEPDDLEVLDFIHHQLMKSIDDVQTIVCTKNISSESSTLNWTNSMRIDIVNLRK